MNKWYFYGSLPQLYLWLSIDLLLDEDPLFWLQVTI